jgi:flagellar motor switch/type III secretory pathway protein FliN
MGRTSSGADRSDAPQREAALEMMGEVRFRLRVMAGRGVATVGRVLALENGALLPLESTPRDKVELVCGDVLVARGEIVSSSGALRFRVTEVVA